MDEVTVVKRERSTNITSEKQDLIIDIVLRYKDIIENKKTDCISTKQKEAAWSKVATEFDSLSKVHRSSKQL